MWLFLYRTWGLLAVWAILLDSHYKNGAYQFKESIRPATTQLYSLGQTSLVLTGNDIIMMLSNALINQVKCSVVLGPTRVISKESTHYECCSLTIIFFLGHSLPQQASSLSWFNVNYYCNCDHNSYLNSDQPVYKGCVFCLAGEITKSFPLATVYWVPFYHVFH